MRIVTSNSRIVRLAFITTMAVTLSGCIMEEDHVAGLQHPSIYGGSKSYPIHSNGKNKIHVRKCGDWTDNAEETESNKLRKNHGCAVQSNIAAMIAHPNDIHSNGATGSHNSTSDVSAIVRSREAVAAEGNGSTSGGGGTSK